MSNIAPALPGAPPVWMARTLMAEGDGFFFAEGVQEPSLGGVAESQDVYLSLAKALVRLRHGDFAAAENVADVLLANDAEDVWIAGGHLLAHSVPRAPLLAIGQHLLDAERGEGAAPDFVRAYVCRIWARAMILPAVPEMIETYRRTRAVDARTRILMEIADVLEVQPGDLYDAIDVGSEGFDEEAYLNILMEHYSLAREVAAASGTELFYRGAPFAFPNWARGFLTRAAKNDRRANFGCDRMIFEANSGVRCSDFFSPSKDFILLAAASIVEEFLDSEEIERCEPGARYFMGNRIPD